MDEYLEVDPNYEQMVETYDGAVKLAEDTLNNAMQNGIDSMFENLEEILEEGNDEWPISR